MSEMQINRKEKSKLLPAQKSKSGLNQSEESDLQIGNTVSGVSGYAFGIQSQRELGLRVEIQVLYCNLRSGLNYLTRKWKIRVFQNKIV